MSASIWSANTIGAHTQRQWNIGTLAVGQTGYIDITGRITNGLLPFFLNTGVIVYDGGMSYDEEIAEQINGATIQKLQRNRTTNSGGYFAPYDMIVYSGDVVNYELRFANPSSVDPVTLYITDIFPMGFDPQVWSTTLGTNGAFLPPQYNDQNFRYHTRELLLLPGQT